MTTTITLDDAPLDLTDTDPVGKPVPVPDEPSKPDHKRTPPKRRGQFVKPLTDLYTSVGMMVLPFDPVCGQAVIESAEECAKSLDELAYQNEAVRRVIRNILETSAVGTVILAHAPILMTVAMHHAPGLARFRAEPESDDTE